MLIFVNVPPIVTTFLFSPGFQSFLEPECGSIVSDPSAAQAKNCRLWIVQVVRNVPIGDASSTQLSARGCTVDTVDMTENAPQTSHFEDCCLEVLKCYAVRDAASKASIREYTGWLDRIQNVPGIETSSLTGIHGFLIAQGLIRFEFTGRSVGLQYQLSTQGRESIARESVYLSDDPYRNELTGSETESAEQAA